MLTRCYTMLTQCYIMWTQWYRMLTWCYRMLSLVLFSCRLELELERDKRERDAREREIREREIRDMEMREKMEMKAPGKLLMWNEGWCYNHETFVNIYWSLQLNQKTPYMQVDIVCIWYNGWEFYPMNWQDWSVYFHPMDQTLWILSG